MRRSPRGYRNGLSGLAVVVMLSGCAQHSAQENGVTQAGDSSLASGSVQDVDRVFEQANADPRSGLDALDLERIGLGNYWNMLDENGDGQVSRQEFRRRFDDPAIQRQLQMTAPSSQQGRLEPGTAPATLSTPSAAAWGVAPPETSPESETPGASTDSRSEQALSP
ncbi:hypothetical protein [Kushneria indalinina]|uniref:EF-hand domain-containing protein n=1 Tax=Kushneria indalinina DSM 14324 TaxID=1122140 RepID=A0A3D9DZ96_9GAMM|nr:hypothetical protein [Kushneria indalinina]REC95975.1 hypothetical protein C8D72_0644 [Kushneria indalinina DSM 14324]